MVFESIKRVFGGMNKDSELLDIKQGDSLEQLNVRTITAHGSTSGSAEAIQGGEFAFDLGEVIQQNKIVRITFDTSLPVVYNFQLLDQNSRGLMPNQTFNTAPFINNISGFLASVVSTLNTALSTYGQTANITVPTPTNPTTGYIDFELTTVLGRNYNIGRIASVELQEAIDKSIAGKNIAIGSYDLLGDLFVLSTTVSEDPIIYTITNVTNTSPVVVTTSTPHGLVSGENIEIKSVGGTLSANGLWIINVINSTQVTLIGSLASSAYTGGGTLTKNVNGFGELGVAQKNVATDTWTYISLASTRRFNFRSMHQAEMRAEIDGLRKSIYWTDNNDYYRVAYYYGAYVANGLFSTVNSQAIYTLDSLDDETRLFLSSPNPFFIITQGGGGQLKCGNWRYAVRFIVEGSIATEWSYLSNPINVYPTPTSGNPDAQYVVGGTPTEISNKLNIIQVDNFPTGVYNFIELAAIQYVGEVPIGSIAIRQGISQGDVSATIVHTGTSVNEIELDLSTLSQVFASIVKGQNLLLLDNRLVASNFYVQRDYDLSGWAQNIQSTVKRRALQSIEFIGSPNGLKLEEYLKPTNTVNFVGYMLNETYRFAVRVKWKNSSWSVPYFIRDITITYQDNSLTDSTGTQIFVYYVQFTNLDINFVLPDGQVLRDLIEDNYNIQFLRAEMNSTNWEVLCTGVLAGSQSAPPYQPNTNFIAHPPSAFTGSTEKGFFYSPDIYFKGAYPSNTGGLVMKFLDTPTYNSGFTSGTNNLEEYNGYFFGSSFVDKAITGTSVVDLSALFWGNNVVQIDSVPLIPPLANGAADVGLNYIQLFRPLSNKFGNPDTTRYVTTGNPFQLFLTGSITDTFDVYGGDTFTQKSFKVVKSVSSTEGYGISFFSQNRVNSQMQLGKDASGGTVYTVPGVGGTTSAGLLNFLKVSGSSNLNVNGYNTGYNIQNLLQFYIGFSAQLAQQSYYPVRIAWSEQKTINGISDAYRVILPLNYFDLMPSFGSITHMESLNGTLYTWQPRKFMRQYFKSNGELTSDVGQILVGDGSVMSRDGVDISQYGSSHKWGIIRGATTGGGDFANWINAEFKKLMRFGEDGSVVLSDEKFMQSFFSDNLAYTMSFFTPSNNYGITAVYNTRFAEAIFTVRCINPSSVLAEIGQAVTSVSLRYGSQTSFDGIPIIYRAKSSFTITEANYPGTGANWTEFWDKLAFNDKSAYNVYTVVSNEYINRITTFLTFKPRIYLKYRDGYLSPSPFSNNKIFEHDRGEYMEWYKESFSGTGTVSFVDGSTSVIGIGTDFITTFPTLDAVVYTVVISGTEYEVESVNNMTLLTLKNPVSTTGTGAFNYTLSNSENGYVLPVINDQPNDNKGYRAIRVNSEVSPFRVDFTTEHHESYLTASEFEDVEKIYMAPIKCDSTVSAENPTGSNEADTTKMWGKYLTAKIFFERKKYQKIYDIIVKFVTFSRKSNQ